MGRGSKCCNFSCFVNDGVGIGCAVFTYLLIAYGEFVVVFVMLLPEVISAAAFGIFHAIAFTFFSCLAVISHSRSMCSDPGTIPLGNCTSENVKKLQLQEGEVVLRCTRCECIKLARAHHCSTCHRCIRKMDHHCPWINNCVGEDNQKFSILFTFYICFLFFVLNTPTTSYHNSAQSYSSDACSAMSSRTQFSVLMASYINKSMDAAWATHYLQSLQTFSWLN